MASPARQQYLEIKRRHPDAILMFRLGDFYEMFDEDAEVASGILGIQLTARNYPRGEGRVPMAGVPFHSVHGYVKRLLDAGHRVALCEQLTPPGKGIVDRDVLRVFTPGTVVEPDMLNAEENNFLAAVFPGKDAFGLAYLDVSTGEFVAGRIEGQELLDAELLRLGPSECIAPDVDPPVGIVVSGRVSPRAEMDAKRAERVLRDHLGVETLAGFGLDAMPEAVAAAAFILEYLSYANRPVLDLVDSIRSYNPSRFMVLDRYTRASLELMPRPGEPRSRWTLLKVIDRTKTGMGARLLRQMLSRPLLDAGEITARLDAVEAFVDEPMLVKRLEANLGAVGDLERLTGRIVQGRAGAIDLNQLRLSLAAAEVLREPFGSITLPSSLAMEVESFPDLRSKLEQAIDTGGGGAVKAGYSHDLDRLRSLVTGSRDALAELERTEVEATGVKTLRVGYNKVFGYYFEVGKTAAKSMPERFVRQQTLLNAERFITPELKELESAILTAEQDAATLEKELFKALVEEVKEHQAGIMATATAVAEIDVFRSLAAVALANSYCRPVLDGSCDLDIRAGRHPVVEASDSSDGFVPNDCCLDEDQRIVVLTGPNMGGKSTMLRTVALIAIMAQIGSFVPAGSATIGIVDRVFSRVGAQDDIASGQSTFMTEMIETANILHNATGRSLLILDEIGRGTSTYDGLAIARAVVEFIHARVKARTLFATHYHELAALESELDRVRNFHTEIAEHEGRVIFLHKILPGSADRSYGIHVARLAGLPHSVTVRADRLLRQLEKSSNGAKPSGPQLALFADPDLAPKSEIEEAAVRVLDQILALDLTNTTPLQALEELHKLQTEGRSSR